MVWRHDKRPPRQIWGTGVQHRPDDISIISKDALTDVVERSVTQDGKITTDVTDEEYNSLNLARRVQEYRNTLNNQLIIVLLEQTSVGIEVLVTEQTPQISVGVAFGGGAAGIPADSATISNSSEVKSGEARFYNVKTNAFSLRTAASNVGVRVTVLMP